MTLDVGFLPSGLISVPPALTLGSRITPYFSITSREVMYNYYIFHQHRERTKN